MTYRLLHGRERALAHPSLALEPGPGTHDGERPNFDLGKALVIGGYLSPTGQRLSHDAQRQRSLLSRVGCHFAQHVDPPVVFARFSPAP